MKYSTAQVSKLKRKERKTEIKYRYQECGYMNSKNRQNRRMMDRDLHSKSLCMDIPSFLFFAVGPVGPYIGWVMYLIVV
ncbi:hypothetical protein BHYA_0079g00350 [Botrytis hyacinthi]|uniref:Uncharacterized protein n=1 Tax=Botrytis hyacinthi TaxID=278943 RepID=A0A4Z1GMR5_9HELO|nr:hypothetical protein BHYA_0079g00350 [Botrytis hyacinthi]